MKRTSRASDRLSDGLHREQGNPMEHAPETIFGERGVQTAHNIANLALGRVSPVDLGPNYSVGAGGSIEVRFDAASAAVFADPDAYSASR